MCRVSTTNNHYHLTGLLYENQVQRSPIYSLVVLRALSKVTNKLYIYPSYFHFVITVILVIHNESVSATVGGSPRYNSSV